MANLLKVENLIKTYQEGAEESRAVDKVDLEVDEGEFVIIMGASGSGKTSLLHLIAGIDTPDSGTILYQHTVDLVHIGDTAKAMFRRKNIGIVFQQQCLIPDLTVYENIMLPAMLAGNREAKDLIPTLCRQFGLAEHSKKYPSQLSGGQQQRTAILRAVINHPTLLLCDEPTGSLNSAQSKTVMDMLDALNKEGQTIVLVTHDVKVAARGRRVVYVADGRIAGDMRFSDIHTMKHRETELTDFLQQRGW